MIIDKRNEHQIYTLLVIEIVAAMVLGLVSTIPRVDREIVTILISAATLSLTLALIEVIALIRSRSKDEPDNGVVTPTPPV
jgi:hypothetical protein